MRMITRMLLASVLAIGAGSVAGCGDDTADCPSNVAQGTSCTATGLSCFTGSTDCICKSGTWQCEPPDMSIVVHMDLSHLPTSD